MMVYLLCTFTLNILISFLKISFVLGWFVFMFNATFNNILVISCWSVLFVENPVKTTDLSQVIDKLYQIMVYRPSGIRTLKYLVE